MTDVNCNTCIHFKTHICNTCSIENEGAYVFSNYKAREKETKEKDITIHQTIQKPLIYLACPYSHKDKATQKLRFKMVSKIAGQLIFAGNLIYSPISHTAPMAHEARMHTNYEQWQELDEFYLERSDILVILQLPGWEDSVGIKQEMTKAADLSKPIMYLPCILDVNVSRSSDNTGGGCVPSSSE